jgi:hypothetical protein
MRKVLRLFNAAKKSGNWTDSKRNLTNYNKALRQAKRESWRRQSEEIEKAPECARLQRILSTDGHSAVSSLQLENGAYTNREGEPGGITPGPLPWFKNNFRTFWRLGLS